MEEKRLLKRKRKANESGNLEQLSHYCRELGDYYRKVGKCDEALQQFKEEENINVALNRPIAIAVSNRMIGEIYCDIGDFKEALKYQEKHLGIAKREKNGIEEQRALANLGRTYFCMAESITASERKEYESYLSSAKKVYIRSLLLCDEIQGIGHLVQMEMRARLLLNIGLVLECQGNLNEAIDYIGKAINIAKGCDLSEELFRCYSAFGVFYHRRGDCNKALEFLNKAVEVAERLQSHGKHACEVLLSKGEVLFSIGDFEGAKQALLKAYKLRTPDGNERQAIEKNLRIAAKLCQTEMKVLSMDSNDQRALKSLYEVLGDGVVAVGNFKKAIEYYLKMLKCAEAAGESNRALVPIYFSLAQTYKDDCQYDLALEYSRKELAIIEDNPQEACKTMLIISELLELKNAPYVEVAGSYLKAREFAVRAKDWKLLVTTLHCLQSYQKNSALGDLAEETEKECKEIKERYQVQMSSDDEGGSGEEGGSTFGGSIDLNELAESGSDDEDGQGNQLHMLGDQSDRRSKRRKATFRSLAVQRNEKGETALHRACISGNTTLVRRLIERGHPLNIRDNCGWTPLHEACNHGHEDIVAVLIESGAQVNDRGGTLCGGVTPIHDAASCGNLSVVRMLLDAGALLTVKTDKGETPLDCLRQWYGRVRDEIDLRTEEEFRGLEVEMSRSLEKIAGQEPPAVTLRNERQPRKSNTLQGDSGSEPLISIPSGESGSRVSSRRKRTDGGVTRREISMDLSSPEEDGHTSEGSKSSDDEGPMHFSARLMAKDISQREIGSMSRHSRMKGKVLSASSEYARTIASLKNRQSLLTLSKDAKGGGGPGGPSLTTDKAPHLAEDEVDVDDWLEDDLGTSRPPLKRAKRLVNPLVVHTLRSTPGGQRSSESPLRDTPSPPSEPLEAQPNGAGNQLEGWQDNPSNQTLTMETAQHANAIGSPEALQQMQPSCAPSIQLVKVDVEGTLLLVPLDRSITFEDLAKEVSRRYQEFKGVSVELTLHTREGAMLSKNDPVTLLLSLTGGGDPQAMSLVAHVTSLTLPPITESYEKACLANHVDPNVEVCQSLEVCQAIHTLSLDDMDLGPREFGAVAQVVSQHRNLAIRSLLLASNDIGDTGLKGLSAMQGLVMLDLSCNGITAVGLSDLASVISPKNLYNHPLQALGELNLSHNPIKDAGFPYLVAILSSLLSLTSLSLRDCSLSACDFACSNTATPTMSLNSLEQLDVSLNALGAEGVAGFLAALQPANLKTLNVSRTLGRGPSTRKIAREVALLFTQGDCNLPTNLVELDLSHTQVNDSDLYEVLRGLEHSNLLEKIGLECNSDLTTLSLRRLLQRSSWPNLYISLSGCPKILDYMQGDDIVGAVGWMHRPANLSLPSGISLSVGGAVDESAVAHLVAMWESAVGPGNALVERGLFGHLKLGTRGSSPALISVP